MTIDSLDRLLTVLAPMPRASVERTTPDWLNKHACLHKFSESALSIVAAELETQWKQAAIRCRPTETMLLGMLHAAQTAEIALAILTQNRSRQKKGRTSRVP